jgi:hypothetical protein
MKRINLNNYEAFLLDYLEGNLDEESRYELEAFLKDHPDLASDLDDFEDLRLTPENVDFDPSALKVPNLERLRLDVDARDALYFKAVEGAITTPESTALSALIEEAEFRKEFDLWKLTKLRSEDIPADRSTLYRLPLALPINARNFDYFLIARAEGLLTEAENEALETYVSGSSKGKKELELADSIRLEPPKGIFYPDKETLKKKERRGFGWLYRAAVIAFLLAFPLTWFFLRDGSTEESSLAKTNTEVSDTLKTEDKPLEKLNRDSIPVLERTIRPQLQEWEMVEPDPVEYASSVIPRIEEEKGSAKTYSGMKKLEPLYAEINLPRVDGSLQETQDASSVKKEPPAAQEYLTLAEYAERRLANELELSDVERDQMALSLARRITEKAGDALDTEIKKEADPDSDQLTYSLRIGSFKISRTTAK